MARFRNWSSSAALLLAAPALAAIELPAGTELHCRLENPISSTKNKPGDPVTAVLTVPVPHGEGFALAAGAKLTGRLEEAKSAAGPEERARLRPLFDRLEIAVGAALPLQARVLRVENARETFDDNGRIFGILASETFTAQIDRGIGKMQERYSGLAGVLAAVKGALFKPADTEISYDAGVDLVLKLAAPLRVERPASGPGYRLEPVANEAELIRLVNAQPFQTVAENPPKPSDITNLMYVGTQQEVEAAFTAAGWSTAAALSGESKWETMRAIVENRGYKEAPMSILLLEKQKPALVFQKQLNTFAMRHHLRIWRRPGAFAGKPVWVCAATHDIGIEFSDQNRTFIHKIDSEIDKERAKVVSDLLFTGKVKSLALVDRPEVPKESRNATGDELKTDGRMAVLIF